jgi:hypothetical protein
MEALYKSAARKSLRIVSSRGSVSVEDLFDLPLTELDRIYRDLAPKVASQDHGLMRQRTDSDDELRLALVKDVFETRQAEADAANARKENQARKLRLLQLIEQKQDASLAEKSVEELTALVNQL